MLEVFIGAFSGIFSGIGMGGGTILIFLLTTFAQLEQHIAQATNLIYFVPTAISAVFVNYRNKNIDIKNFYDIYKRHIVDLWVGLLYAFFEVKNEKV